MGSRVAIEAFAIVLVVAIIIGGGALAALSILRRNPELERRNRELKERNRELAGLVESIYQIATRAGDIDPSAQNIAGEIEDYRRR